MKRWALLYPGSEVNPPRLETFDNKDASYKEGAKPLVLYLPCPIKAFPTSQHRSRDFVIEIKTDDKVVAYAVDTRSVDFHVMIRPYLFFQGIPSEDLMNTISSCWNNN